ncbi:transcriptional regulator NrdR [Chloroflexota bacterium]
MDCPNCHYHDSKVIDSRDVNESIRRRRQCLNCGYRFTTYERLQRASLLVIKKDLRREEFNKDKLLTGIRKACEKRPLPTGATDTLVDDIEADLYREGRAEIYSRIIGDMVMERLRKLDYIAYIRFASVYREFTDITALKQEVDSLVNGEPKISHLTAQLSLLQVEGMKATVRRQERRQR